MPRALARHFLFVPLFIVSPVVLVCRNDLRLQLPNRLKVCQRVRCSRLRYRDRRRPAGQHPDNENHNRRDPHRNRYANRSGKEPSPPLRGTSPPQFSPQSRRRSRRIPALQQLVQFFFIQGFHGLSSSLCCLASKVREFFEGFPARDAAGILRFQFPIERLALFLRGTALRTG